VVLDLSQTRYLDSSGVRLMYDVVQQVQAQGRRMTGTARAVWRASRAG
jgi:anti-anti-sigma regulatory factor